MCVCFCWVGNDDGLDRWLGIWWQKRVSTNGVFLHVNEFFFMLEAVCAHSLSVTPITNILIINSIYVFNFYICMQFHSFGFGYVGISLCECVCVCDRREWAHMVFSCILVMLEAICAHPLSVTLTNHIKTKLPLSLSLSLCACPNLCVWNAVYLCVCLCVWQHE